MASVSEASRAMEDVSVADILREFKWGFTEAMDTHHTTAIDGDSEEEGGDERVIDVRSAVCGSTRISALSASDDFTTQGTGSTRSTHSLLDAGYHRAEGAEDAPIEIIRDARGGLTGVATVSLEEGGGGRDEGDGELPDLRVRVRERLVPLDTRARPEGPMEVGMEGLMEERKSGVEEGSKPLRGNTAGAHPIRGGRRRRRGRRVRRAEEKIEPWNRVITRGGRRSGGR